MAEGIGRSQRDYTQALNWQWSIRSKCSGLLIPDTHLGRECSP